MLVKRRVCFFSLVVAKFLCLSYFRHVPWMTLSLSCSITVTACIVCGHCLCCLYPVIMFMFSWEHQDLAVSCQSHFSFSQSHIGQMILIQKVHLSQQCCKKKHSSSIWDKLGIWEWSGLSLRAVHFMLPKCSANQDLLVRGGWEQKWSPTLTVYAFRSNSQS